MTTFSTWFNMHGYALYLWPAYGLVTVVLMGHCLSGFWRGRRTRLKLRDRFRSL